ncbi:diacylglycerol kinase theta-like [Sycon ciliatum]|uniref:diacylglycerol kinase theta-like n=1 Tax=Sycon ciliatum TaxID=27933 RepID=UPI0031F61D06
MSNGGGSADKSGSHTYHKKTFRPGSVCHYCGEHVWVSGYTCKVCRFVTHEKCMNDVTTPCTSVAPVLVKDPVAHRWGEKQKFKRTFCNVCRKRMDDSLGYRCEVCKYYVHASCNQFCVQDCKRVATYNPHVPPEELGVQLHHWREGNLKPSSKCAVCKNVCSSQECLVSLRCAWCCKTVHSSCRQFLDISCEFGALKHLMLPPASVSMPNMAMTVSGPSSSRSSMFGSREDLSTDCVSCSTALEDTVSISDANSDGMSICSNTIKLKVYDGHSRRQYKSIRVSSDATATEILSCALQEYQVPASDSRMFMIGVERGAMVAPLDDLSECTVAALQNGPPLVIRSRSSENEDMVIRVFPGQFPSAADFKTLSVSPITTAQEVVATALTKYGIPFADTDLDDFGLIEVNLFEGVRERLLDTHEKPWKILHDAGKRSVRHVQLTRFYLKNLRTKNSVHLYVGNLPTSWEVERYSEKLKQAMGLIGTGKVEIGPIFPTFGAVIIQFTNSADALEAYLQLKTAMLIEQKKPVVIIIPEIVPEIIKDDCSPVLAFVNERSGGGQGVNLLTAFRRFLNPHQVFNLSTGGPLPGLYAFRNVPSYRLVVCGGDGTVGWVLSLLDELRPMLKCQSPAVAVIPLGTGNDLARVMKWGSGVGTSSSNVLELLIGINESETISMDRWVIRFENDAGATRSAVDNLITSDGEAHVPGEVDAGLMTVESFLACSVNHWSTAMEEQSQTFIMNNYFGVGIDADIALKFHLKREEAPEKFNSRIHNKGMYLKMSLAKMMQRSGNLCKQLPRVLSIEVDGELVKMPSGVEGIIILNISSWMAGCDAWGSDRDDKFKPAALNDGMLEVIGVQGVMHLGQIQGNIRGGLRLAQGSSLVLTMASPMPVQIDGEPWLQPVSRCTVQAGHSAQMLRRLKKQHSGATANS